MNTNEEELKEHLKDLQIEEAINPSEEEEGEVVAEVKVEK